MNSTLLAFLIALPVFIAIDLIWLMGPGRPIYVTEIGSLLRATPNMGAAAMFYIVYAAGLVFFAVNPALAVGNASLALINGLILGFMAYATYDLTNLAVLNGFTLRIAAIDLVWGSILSGTVAWVVAKLTIMLA